jgi:hypothetical protein
MEVRPKPTEPLETRANVRGVLQLNDELVELEEFRKSGSSKVHQNSYFRELHNTVRIFCCGSLSSAPKKPALRERSSPYFAVLNSIRQGEEEPKWRLQSGCPT